jgi:hypothetical protein
MAGDRLHSVVVADSAPNSRESVMRLAHGMHVTGARCISCIAPIGMMHLFIGGLSRCIADPADQVTLRVDRSEERHLCVAGNS